MIGRGWIDPACFPQEGARKSMMMTKIFGMIAVLGWAVSTCAAAEKAAEWSVKMQALQQTLSDLMVDVSSDQRYGNPENFRKIEDNAKRMAELVHALQMPQTRTPDSDPTLMVVSGLLSQDVERAHQELKRGNRGYARSLLRTLSGYCISCHTRGNSGPSFQGLNLAAALATLSPLEKAEYLAATRQYDQALEQFEAILADPVVAQARPFEFERAARYGLVIAIRVKKDPVASLRLIDRVMNVGPIPYFLKEQAQGWRESLNAWSAEAPRKVLTEEGLYAEATRLLGKAKSLQKYPADRSGDVYYLRASSVIHEMLGRFPNGKRSQEAFLMAGMTYEVLRDLDLWTLHEIYYTACVHRVPHSKLARSCYRHFEESVYGSYSGSGGTALPKDVLKRLADLDELSKPVVTKTGDKSMN